MIPGTNSIDAESRWRFLNGATLQKRTFFRHQALCYRAKHCAAMAQCGIVSTFGPDMSVVG